MNPSLFQFILNASIQNELQNQAEAKLPFEERAKNFAKTTAELTPILGDAITAKEAYDYFENNQPVMGSLMAGAAVLPFAPQIVKGVARKGKQFLESPVMETPRNVLNQTASNMPTTIKGFYEGNPIGSFARDFTNEIAGAIDTRLSATSRAFQDVWGISERKVQDVLGKGSAPAVRTLDDAKRKADILRESGLTKEADAVMEQGRKNATKTGEDSAFTAMSIEGQQGKTIIPVEERGAFANSVYGTEYTARAIPQDDVAKLSDEIGNGNRLEGDDIPDNVTNRMVNHLVKGPHVDSKSSDIYEYQVKGLDASRTAGIKESEGFRNGSMLVRAFNKGDSDNTITVFDSYIKALRGKKGGTDLTPEESIEFLQLAATLNKRNVDQINRAMFGASQMTDRQMLDSLAKARYYQREGKNLTAKQNNLVKVFEDLVRGGQIQLNRITDEAGNQVGNLDFSKIKKPEGNVATSSYFLSQQKELGGVNQAMVMDIKNKTNYTMISDGHDIFGEAPLGGHHLITAQPITKRKWGESGFKTQHKTTATKEKIQTAVADTAKRLGVELPDKLRTGNYKDLNAYRRAAKAWTDDLLRKKQGVTVGRQHMDAASESARKLRVAQNAIGTTATLGATGMLINEMSGEE
jgi:hypothetical protein